MSSFSYTDSQSKTRVIVPRKLPMHCGVLAFQCTADVVTIVGCAPLVLPVSRFVLLDGCSTSAFGRSSFKETEKACTYFRYSGERKDLLFRLTSIP